MSLRLRLAELLTGRLPEPHADQLPIVLLRPRAGRITVPKLCSPNVRGGISPAIGRSLATIRLPWATLEPATVSHLELLPLLFPRVEVKRHFELLVNRPSVEFRMLEVQERPPEVDESHVGCPERSNVVPDVEVRAGHEEETLDEVPSPPSKIPKYRPPRPPRVNPKTVSKREGTGTGNKGGTDFTLQIRVQLVFGRGGSVKRLALVPERRGGMPSDIQVTGAEGRFYVTDLRDDCYEPVVSPDMGNALLQGVEWFGRDGGRCLRWVLSRRELFVLAPGGEFGLHGFVSTSRLSLHARHQVLTTVRQRDQILSALTEAGCSYSDVYDETTAGIPQGWLLFRDVIPTRAVPMHDEDTPLNALCPPHDVEPHFVGGIRLWRRTWLLEFPPRIHFTGEIPAGYQIMLDGSSAEIAADSAFESPGWDAQGRHRMFYGDKTIEYELCRMEEQWELWHAYDFGTGARICGASVCVTESPRRHPACVSAKNTLLIGARPGEIFRYRAHDDMPGNHIVLFAPFVPVWALPANPLQADKRSARILLLNTLEPRLAVESACDERITVGALRAWTMAINNAARKRLLFADARKDTAALWQRYRNVAKQLWRKIR